MNVIDDDDLVCPFIIWKLLCRDVLGPMSTSNSAGIFTAGALFTSCVSIWYVNLNWSPSSTVEGADAVMVCPYPATVMRQKDKSIYNRLDIIIYKFVFSCLVSITRDDVTSFSPVFSKQAVSLPSSSCRLYSSLAVWQH